jgi:NADPH2:quinone reductase
MKTTQRVFWLDEQSGLKSLKLAEISIPKPKDNEILIKHTAIGINFTDYQYISGAIPLPKTPFIPGMEAVGIVEAVGKSIKTYNVGQRVGYATSIGGGFSEYRTLREELIFPIHDGISDESAVINLTKGMTAHYLMRRTFFVHPEMKILLHGALSNVARLMVPLAKHYKAEIYGTVEKDSQVKIAKDLGYSNVFTYSEFDKHISKNTFNVVYDGIGGGLLSRSINVIQPFGLLVNFGNAINPFVMPSRESLEKKSLFLTFPNIQNYKQNNKELCLRALEVFALIYGGIFPSVAKSKYSFEEIPVAIKNIEERKNVGPIAIML